MKLRALIPAGSGLVLCLVQSVAMAAEDWHQPMTSWGEPDIQGMWPINHLIGVGLQRDPKFGDRFLMTEEEFETEQAEVAARDNRFSSGAIPAADTAGTALRQTSLIFDPPDGQFPALTEYGLSLQENMRSSYRPGQTVFDDISDFSAWDRCITRGMPVSMLPRNYNNGIRIFQSPGYVVILLEMAHEARIIPTSEFEALENEVRQWLGESRGHWEGNTLVVETSNFNGLVGKTSAGVPGSPGPLQPSTPSMRITERFTRTGPNTMDFEMVVEDAEVLATGSYTVRYPMMLDNDYDMYEYACHEGNTAVRYYIETYRYERDNQ